ncbi:hypothetical protein C8R46DRAFT_1143499 [Mycena filopes]|nr:hypothetical protein C8R46DRAFT_1143499 [Mycena filopes]
MAKEKPAPLRRSPRKHTAEKKPKSLGRIDWDADSSEMTFELITQMEVKENRLVLFGKQGHENTSGDSKVAVFKRMGSVLFPTMYLTSPNTLGKRVKGKVESLVKTYKKFAKKLQVTGGGLEKDDSGDVHEFLECYISSEGPDHDTSASATNLWEQIKKDFVFFPRLHALLAAQSNIVPPMIATGVGPEGRKVVHLQAPATTKTEYNPHIDPALQSTPHRSRSASPSSPINVDSSPLAPVGKRPQKTAPKASSFGSGGNGAKPSQPRQRKTFEDNIIHIQTKMMHSQNRREDRKVEHDRARLRLDENNQLLALFNAGVLDAETLRQRLDLVAIQYADPPPKRRHESPVAGPSKRTRRASVSSSDDDDAGDSSVWDRNGSASVPGSEAGLGYR